MEFYALLKKNARRALSEQWGGAIAIVILGAGVSFLFSLLEMILSTTFSLPRFEDIINTPAFFLDDQMIVTTGAFLVAAFIALMHYVITIPLRLGETHWLYNAGMASQEGISSIFEYFSTPKLFLKAILLDLAIRIRVFLFAVLFLLPANLCFLIAAYHWSQPTEPAEKMLVLAICLCGFVFLVIGAIATAIIKGRYFVVPYLILHNQNMKISKAIRQSVAATQGRLPALFLFELSFVGWYLFSLLILPILYVRPYIGVSRGLYARYLILRENARRNPPEEQAL